MNFWWVNHSQTFRHEFLGKYIWSPKRKRNDQINPFYETMREVAPGDIVFSFADGKIHGFGVAQTHGYTCPRPLEFGQAGMAWNELGWRVDVNFQKFTVPILLTHHMQATYLAGEIINYEYGKKMDGGKIDKKRVSSVAEVTDDELIKGVCHLLLEQDGDAIKLFRTEAEKRFSKIDQCIRWPVIARHEKELISIRGELLKAKRGLNDLPTQSGSG